MGKNNSNIYTIKQVMNEMTDKEIEDAKKYLVDLKKRRDVKPIGSRCPELCREYKALWQKINYQENKEAIKAQQKEYREPRKAEIAKKGNDYYHENKDTKIKEYRENNAEKIRAYKKKYSLKYLAENKERLIAYRKAYYLKKKAEKNEQ